jgi:hypothetical protein
MDIAIAYSPARPAWQVSLFSGAIALVVIEAYGAAARAAGVPMTAAAFGAHHASTVGAGALAFGVALGVFWATVLAAAFGRFTTRPARAFGVTTMTMLALSLTGPLTAHAATSTKLTLVCGHLIAAAIIIPAVTRRLAR